MPGVVYVFTGFNTADVVPSPKDHDDETGAGEDVFVIEIGVPTQAVKGAVKSALTVPITIGLGLVKVSVQPVEFVTINCTV